MPGPIKNRLSRGLAKPTPLSRVRDLTVPGSGATLLVEVAFERAVPLRGRVFDTEAEPVEGVVVAAQSGEYGRSVQDACRTAADGSFEITGVPTGTLELSASRTGLVRQVDGRRLKEEGPGSLRALFSSRC